MLPVSQRPCKDKRALNTFVPRGTFQYNSRVPRGDLEASTPISNQEGVLRNQKDNLSVKKKGLNPCKSQRKGKQPQKNYIIALCFDCIPFCYHFLTVKQGEKIKFNITTENHSGRSSLSANRQFASFYTVN